MVGEGFRDLVRRLRIAWLRIARVRLRRALAAAEVELGWLGWEQVDFFDLEINDEVKKVQEYETTQASLLNTSAELSGRKAVLDEELAREKETHDKAQADLAAERAPIAAELDEAETKRRNKLEAIERFDRALAEIARLEKQFEARSLSFMGIDQPSIEVRAEAREISTELIRLSAERNLVLADQTKATAESARLEPGIANLRAELERIDTLAAAARDRLASATRRVTGEMRQLERERKKSSLRMSHLDREKRKPYRHIGACLADHNLGPLNQPHVLQKVLALRASEAELTQRLSALQTACAAADSGTLLTFYLLAGLLLVATAVVMFKLLHR